MSGYHLRVSGAVILILILSLVPTKASSVAVPSDSGPPVSSRLPGKYNLSGVWTGASITGCTPLRMNGPWQCGAKADIMLTFISEDTTAAIAGIYASDRGPASNDYEESGRVVEVSVSGSTRLWFRVILNDHSTCLFTGNLRHEEMIGSYLCFREGISFERGHWAVRRIY